MTWEGHEEQHMEPLRCVRVLKSSWVWQPFCTLRALKKVIF